MECDIKHRTTPDGLYMYSYVHCPCGQPLIPLNGGDSVDTCVCCGRCGKGVTIDVHITAEGVFEALGESAFDLEPAGTR